MDLLPYLDALRRDLAAAAAPGGPEVARTAGLLAGALDAAARLCLLEALSDAAAEITSRLGTASIEVRLRGRDADLVVTELPIVAEEPVVVVADAAADLARITLRLPEPLKEQVERVAAAEGISVNAWLVRAVGTALHGGSPAGPGGGAGRGLDRRITGFAQA
jgi:hypothetical protein